MLLLGIGLLLLVVEVFVTPGFGIVGIVGLAALVGGLGLSLVGAGATWEVVLEAAWQVVLSLILAIGAALVLLRFLPRMPFGRRLVLEGSLSAREGYASAPETDRGWLGKCGAALSILRPAGVADLGGQRVDVVAEGEFIEAGEPVEVVRVDGNRVVVRRLRTDSHPSTSSTPSTKE